MTKISGEDIDHLGQLARIKLSDQEKEQLISELAAILTYVAELKETPTGSQVISQISGLKNVSRKDEITPSLPLEKVLQNAPEKQGNFIKVKKVFV